MRLLLDTHLLLWVANDDERLSLTARKLLSHPENELFFSVSSLWEIAIKTSLNRRDFQIDPRRLRRRLLEQDYRELQITGDHVTALLDLPRHHKDPFDRLLIGQAFVEGLTLVTADKQLKKYPGAIRVV